MSTYTLISSNVLSSSTANVTFSSIPSTYTDLVLRICARTNDSNQNVNINFYYNGNNTSGQFSRTYLDGDGSAASSGRNSAVNISQIMNGADGSTSTTNTFSNAEFYIPNYAGSDYKPSGSFGVTETNATAANMAIVAQLWSNTSAITSISLVSAFGGNFVSGSSFYLYGISKN